MSVVTLFVEYEPVILLLRTLSDFDFQPKTWTGAIARQGGKGEGPTSTVDCPSCEEGVRRVRGVPTRCEECSGRGVIVVDAYTERKVRTLEQDAEAPKRMVRCDECGGSGKSVWWRLGEELTNTCRRCWGAGQLEAPSAPIRPWRGQSTKLQAEAPELGPGDPVIACMERRQLAGSYDELGLALACLRLDRRPLYRLVVGVYVEAEREPEELHVDEALRMGVGLHYVRALMPEEIRVPSWAARYEKRRRERVESNGKEVAA